MQTSPARVGLTGGIGTGKSTVCNLFSELGVTVIDADLISRELVQPGQPLLLEIQNHFGAEVLNDDGELDRPAMRELVFNDTMKRKQLEDLLHPEIYKELVKRSLDAEGSYCILAIPLLIETYGQPYVDRILVIDSTEENQIQRAAQRDSTSPDTIQRIMHQQISREKRLAEADDIIDNNRDVDWLKSQTIQLHEAYQMRFEINKA